MGLATIFVLTTSNACVSLIRNVVSDAVRLPVFVMIIASAVTCIELLMQAFAYEMYQILGIFVPLITPNFFILGRAEAFAAPHPLLPSPNVPLFMGLVFAHILAALVGVRELPGPR